MLYHQHVRLPCSGMFSYEKNVDTASVRADKTGTGQEGSEQIVLTRRFLYPHLRV